MYYNECGTCEKFILGVVYFMGTKQPKQVKGSPYSLDNPVRKITDISYIKEPTGYLCGQSCIAMLAGVTVDEIIDVIKTNKGTSKQDLKKALNYYGIQYAPTSTRFDENIALPDLCVLRMMVNKSNGEEYGHWGLYYNGIYYDPEFGVLNECPPEAKIFQVWEIYA